MYIGWVGLMIGRGLKASSETTSRRLVYTANIHAISKVQIYHPFLVNSLTLAVTCENPFLNLALHLSLASLFLFNPGLSWNLCLLKSYLTRFLPIRLPNMPIPLTISRPRLGSSSTERPYEGFKRGKLPNVSSCCAASAAASDGLLYKLGAGVPLAGNMSSKARRGGARDRRGDEPLLKAVPKM